MTFADAAMARLVLADKHEPEDLLVVLEEVLRFDTTAKELVLYALQQAATLQEGVIEEAECVSWEEGYTEGHRDCQDDSNDDLEIEVQKLRRELQTFRESQKPPEVTT